MKLKPWMLTIALAGGLAALPSYAANYKVGGAGTAISPGSSCWAWDSSCVADFRNALGDPNNFGPSGIINRSIDTFTLGTIDAASLASVNMFIGTWNADSDWSAAQVNAVTNFFLGGGDLFLLQDDSDHDVIGQALGLMTSSSTGSVSNGGSPLFNGPFGVAKDVTQNYAVGRLDEAAVLALHGTVAGRNVEGQVTSAYWRAGEFAAGAGALFINADIDMIASTTFCGLAVCGASYSPLNNNGIFALNTFAFIQNSGGTPPLGGPVTAAIPEPSSYALMLLGLVGVGATSWRRCHPKR